MKVQPHIVQSHWHRDKRLNVTEDEIDESTWNMWGRIYASMKISWKQVKKKNNPRYNGSNPSGSNPSGSINEETAQGNVI